MKRNLIGAWSLVVLSLLLNSTGASAQLPKADVPFAFKVGKAQLLAGCYEITQENWRKIIIRNCKTGVAALSVVHQEHPGKGSPRLVFYHLDKQYFLAEIWGAAGRAGMTVPAPKLEKEFEIANGRPDAGEKVVIALK
jgi:hypothetical protein